jgi:hypothetical protein
MVEIFVACILNSVADPAIFADPGHVFQFDMDPVPGRTVQSSSA